MDFFYKTKGAISIFLVIILVPMMTVSALFVDASKIQLAKGVAKSSGDLALNTALTEYDTVLKDMYGLFATSQNMDEVFGRLEEYYRTSMISGGINEDDADDYTQLVMQHLGKLSEEETSDLLNIEIVDFSAQKVANATLANATLLKKQVVDFMKYRAPINTGLSFLSSLSSFINLSKETDLADKRQDYYEAQQTVMEYAQQAWNAINEYNKSGFINDENYFANMKSDLDSYAAQYKQIHTDTIKNLYCTSGYTVFSGKIRKFGQETVEYNDTEISVTMLYTQDSVDGAKLTDYTKLTTYSATNPAKAGNLKSVLNNCYTAHNAMEGAIENLLKSDGNTYGLQFVVQTNRRNLYNTYIQALTIYYNKVQEMLHAFEFAEAGAADTTEKLWGSTEKSYSEFKDDQLALFDVFSGTFNNAHRQINSELDSFENTIGNKASSATTNSTIQSIYTRFNGYRTTLTDAKESINNAKTNLQHVLEKIQPGGTLDQAKGAWKTAANDSSLNNSTMARQDRAEIQDLGDQFKPADVEKMIARCEKIYYGLDSMIQELDKYTYAGTSISEIDSYATFEYIVGQKYGDNTLKYITYNEQDLDSKIAGWWNAGVFSGGNVNISWTTSQDAQVNFRRSPKLNFYTYLFTHFHKSIYDTTVSAESNEVAVKDEAQEQTYKDTKDKLSEGAASKADTSQSITPEAEIFGISGLPSEGKGASVASADVQTGNDDAAEKTSASLSGMFKDLGNALVDLGTDLRDNLYFADYAMSMFSYDTFEKEAKYNALDANTKKNYQSVKGASAPENMDILSLTKNPINKETCYQYGGEVEYIIYGGSDVGNKLKAYGSIFAIRLGFNLVYAFTSGEIRDGALAIATPISAATLGVIPAPLIQAAIIIGVAIAESSIDLMCLREGMSVPLYKNSKTWNISFSNLVSQLGAAAVSVVQPALNEAINYGVEYMDGWLDKTADELKNLSGEKIDELGDSVQASFETMLEKEAGVVLQKLTTLVENGIEEGIESANEMVSYVDNALDDWLGSLQEDKNGLAYKVKDAAVSFLTEQGGRQIISVYDGIKTAAKDATTNAITQLEELFSGVRTQMQQKVKTMTSSAIESLKSTVKDAARNGAESLKSALNNGINSMFGNSNGKVEATNVSSMISFQYSDYLRLFLLIGLFTDQEGVVLRTADVIQVNMANKLTDNKSYTLGESAAYVQITATVAVKPLLVGLPLFAETIRNDKDDTTWYTFTYTDIRGY